jgi:hypothetical protein
MHENGTGFNSLHLQLLFFLSIYLPIYLYYKGAKELENIYYQKSRLPTYNVHPLTGGPEDKRYLCDKTLFAVVDLHSALKIFYPPQSLPARKATSRSCSPRRFLRRDLPKATNRPLTILSGRSDGPYAFRCTRANKRRP